MSDKPEVKVLEIGFVVYSVKDVERARKFYEGTLGLKETSFFGEGDMSWIEYDIGPGTLAIACGVPGSKPSPNGGQVALEVENFDSAVQRIKEDGATIVHGPMETPVCQMLIIRDPDDNTLIIHKRKAGC